MNLYIYRNNDGRKKRIDNANPSSVIEHSTNLFFECK